MVMVKVTGNRQRRAVDRTTTTTRGAVLCAAVESLESRKLLSSAMPGIAQPQWHLGPAAAGDPSSVDGFSPAEIRRAYGFDGAGGNGVGQTIAIVDAYNDPNIESDLKVFDQHFGLPDPPSFKKVSQSGGSIANVKTDTGWASEIALDVEWAHAIAPGANILLVEAKSDSISDLMVGVNYARGVPGVSVVSLSWGGSEYGGQTAYDHIFSTPAGHGGVTFVAASGDEGSRYGPEWPATSPYVVSVGGTSLDTDQAGTYTSESSWRYSTGGVSAFYSTPSYQVLANTAGRRSAPDVAYNADPNTGFAVYSSVRDGGYVGWQVIGGTSAGAPQWAALIAIANQRRIAMGRGSLDGTADTLPALYGMYAAPGSASYSTYTADFHDIVGGGGSGGLGRRFRSFSAARAGYDMVTGLGSPQAGQVVTVLVNVPGATPVQIPTPTGTKIGKSSKRRHPGDEGSSASDSAGTATTAVTTLLDVGPIRGTAVDAGSGGAGRDLLALAVPQAEAAVAKLATAVVVRGAAPSRYGIVLDLPVGSAEAVAPSLAQTYDAASQAMAKIADELVGPVAAASAAPTMLRLGTGGIDPGAAFSDAMASFAHESGALGAVIADAAAATATSANHARAWAVTAGVLVADVILIGAWQADARAKRRAKRAARAGTFSLVPVGR